MSNTMDISPRLSTAESNSLRSFSSNDVGEPKSYLSSTSMPLLDDDDTDDVDGADMVGDTMGRICRISIPCRRRHRRHQRQRMVESRHPNQPSDGGRRPRLCTVTSKGLGALGENHCAREESTQGTLRNVGEIERASAEVRRGEG